MTAGIDDSAAVRPQDDLYRFVNGTWLAEHEIPADKAIHGAFHALWDTAEQDVRAIVEKSVAAGHPEGSEPRKIASQQCSRNRDLRPYSSWMSVVMFSTQRAAGS